MDRINLYAIILAAGKGTRMKSGILKVAHAVAGQPIVQYVVNAVLQLPIKRIYLVVGHQAELIKERINHKKIDYVYQAEQLGTGHAVMQADAVMPKKENDTVLILAGDCPLITAETLTSLLAIHQESNAAGTVLTTNMKEPGTYGRILRGKMGTVIGIKEARDCSAEEKKIQEINTGIYVFQSKLLFQALKKIKTNNDQKEYYLTDVIHILKDRGHVIAAYCTPDSDQAIGINTRMDLARINKLIYQKNNQHFMSEGVTITDPETTYVDSTVTIGHDTIIEPFSMILGKTKIGANCLIGAHSYLNDAKIADGAQVPPYTKRT